ncbi:UvrD-helicase domain-containing protein [Flavobacterium sp. NRK F10]|uniref:UvrD-helicase domain-containing protein n=1 Tax=Flavobacterium sp. NRK F10 TaxID=2954931 RepID=UPI00209155B1|nr:UvrD-helicase domain-containing protein [Flavobacterium sp. NRK F10]MCO6174597.1 UvrD-helicase domain-containing protein [Flavobacterium sp. NRK F10]
MKQAAFTIYDASAGSGKTYTLTREYLKILFRAQTPDVYKRILAITFTNKAVEEMKNRIVNSLYEFSKGDTAEKYEPLLKDISVETGLSIATIKEKAKEIITHIIHNYTAFGISTIDKFTHKVIRSFAQDLNLPSNFEIALDTDTLLQEAVDVVIAKVGEDEAITQFLLEFTKAKTDDDKNWDVSRELFEVAKLLVNENNAAEIAAFEDKNFGDFSDIKKVLKIKVQELTENTMELGKAIKNLIADEGIDINSFQVYFIRHLDNIQENELKPTQKKYWEPEDIKVKAKAKDADSIEHWKPEILKKLAQVYANYGKIAFYEAFLQNINPLSLLNIIHLEYKKIQEEQNVLSISDFNKIISNEIQDQPAPFIYEKLGDKYRYFFIDEFQDTSVLQWHNLIPLIDNALASEENGVQGSLMIVGDPKQAIYRWRGGKAEQFIALSKDQNPFSNKSKQVERLKVNYRSYDEVVDFNNAFFAFLSGKFENEDYINLYKEFSFQEKNDKPGGCVSVSFIDIPDTENAETFDDDSDYSIKEKIYLDKTKEIIENVRQNGFDYKDITLLTRRKSEGVLLANYLTESGIPILSSETLLIQNATEVKLLVALLRYLNNSKDEESKVFLLYYVAKYKQTELPVHDFIVKLKGLTEKEIELELQKAGVQVSFAHCRKKSLYEAVELLVTAFIQPKANTSYVQYFLDLVLERDSKTQSGIADFLEYWDKTGFQKSIPSPEESDAVRIMTIHKSKGLEFPVVIYPFAEENFSRRIKDKLWIDFDEEDQIDFPKALVNQKSEVETYGQKAKEIYQERSQEEILDAINVLYVALTRAEEQLHIVSNYLVNKSGLPNNLSSYFIEFLQLYKGFGEEKRTITFGSPERISSVHQARGKQGKIEVVSEKLPFQNIRIAQREALMWGSNQQKAIDFGNVLHEILSYIHKKDDLEMALEQAKENGLITMGQQKEVKEVLVQIVTHPELHEFFNSEGEIYNERTIIDQQLGNIKPDRVVVEERKAYLLDYKTGDKKEEHIRQVLSYTSALEKMGFSVVKKVLVYTIGDQVEVVIL